MGPSSEITIESVVLGRFRIKIAELLQRIIVYTLRDRTPIIDVDEGGKSLHCSVFYAQH